MDSGGSSGPGRAGQPHRPCRDQPCPCGVNRNGWRRSVSKYWVDLTTADFTRLPPETVALLPVAAVEQHGPHLPVGTDTMINRGIVAEALAILGPDGPVVVLPEQAV